jgi:ubiquinone/menaquinone biosynthesis C-methylase UbiE
MSLTRLFHPSARPAGHGITIGTPRFYDAAAAALFGGRRAAHYRRLLAASGARAGERVLDVGSGPGYFARMLARAVGPGGSVTGIDAAPEMTAYAARKARRLPQCSFRSGTAESLPFPDGAFDLVVSSLVMHHLTDDVRGRAVAEMRRVLRPGGRLLLADAAAPSGGIWGLLARVSGAAEMHRRVPALEPLVAGAGFAEVRCGDVPPWLRYVSAVSAGGSTPPPPAAAGPA